MLWNLGPLKTKELVSRMARKQMESNGVLMRQQKLTWESEHFVDLSSGIAGRSEAREIV
jgi:hypothetical protein